MALLLAIAVMSLGTWLRTGALWPLGIMLLIVAAVIAFFGTVLLGASGTELVFAMTAKDGAKQRLRDVDARRVLLHALGDRTPFVLYLRNISTEASRPTFTGLEFAPIDFEPRRDSRLEDFALSPVRPGVLVFTIGSYKRLDGSPRMREIFVRAESWVAAFEYLAQRATCVITVVHHASNGVELECTTLARLSAHAAGPPIWLLLNESMKHHGWVKDVARAARWVTEYRGLPTGDAPLIIDPLPRDADS